MYTSTIIYNIIIPQMLNTDYYYANYYYVQWHKSYIEYFAKDDKNFKEYIY